MSLFYEILAGVWVRNGLQIKGQAMTYIQANFCNSMVDMDIYWLQVCAAHLPPDNFVDMCIDMFGVREWLSMAPMSPAQASEQDACMEGLLTFLAILVSSRTNLGNDELTQSRLEVSTLLAAGDKTHSQLLELMPERSGNAHTRNFETVLKELSTYRPPPKGSENLEQGLFVPKPIVWQQYYDPLHVLRRAVHRRDFHASMERFTAYVREKQKAEGLSTVGGSDGASTSSGSNSGALWPPLRPATKPPEELGDPRVLCTSGVLHGALLAVLHRGVHRRHPDAVAPHAPPDHVLALAVSLLHVATQLAAETHQQHNRDVCVASSSWGGRASVSGVPLLSAFTEHSVCDNARTYVGSVPTPAHKHSAQHYPAHYHSDSDTEWEPSEGSGVTRSDSVPDDQSDAGGDAPQIRALEDVQSQALALQALTEAEMEADTPLAITTGAWLAPDPEALIPPAVQFAPTRATPALLPAPADSTSSTDTQVQVHTEQADEQISVNESIISLLLKLHSQLSGRLDSFSLDEPAPATNEPIGDGPHFIGQVLRNLAQLDARCAAAIGHVRQSLWPHQRERQAEQRAREKREKEERSRRAKERQQQLMKEFQQRQKQFLSAMQSMEANEGGTMDWEWEEEEAERDYDCVICNTTAPTTPQDPIGAVVLLQSTSVLGHRRKVGSGDARLALSEAERARLAAQHDTTAAAHHYRVHDELHQHFDQDSWLTSVSVGWEGGVHVQSCGHHLHLRCLQSYLRSLAAPTRPHNLHVERGEFLCPVCRQLANSVLPLAPMGARNTRPAPAAEHDVLAAQVMAMLEKEHPPPTSSNLSEAMGKAMEDMTATAGGKLKQRYGSSPAAIFTFVASLVRTNLECELVQRGGTLQVCVAPRYKPRNECIVPLIVVAGAHARVLRGAGAGLGAAAAWRALCPAKPDNSVSEGRSSPPVPAPASRPVPLLLRDPLALLVQFLLLAPPNPPYMDIQHFTCIVRALYTLTYYQIVCQFMANASASGRAALAAHPAPNEPQGLRHAARVLLSSLAGSELFTEDGPPTTPSPADDQPDITQMEAQLQTLLLPFVRIAALLRHHLYGHELPDIQTPQQEFVRLAYYLELVCDGMQWSEWCAARALPPDTGAARAWARELGNAAHRGQLVVRRLLRSLHVEWSQPALLALPRDYDRLFTYYHERVCLQCGAVPKEASVCLLCGTLVCLKQPCCRQHNVAEAVQHAMECGGGTGIFLVVTSTYIIVIRGRRACLWGSLYLDDYDEEDRDLKRGKPLYLSQDRLQLLQAQWLAHRFDHTKRTWVWHRDSL
ncbi:E3 ubiquitin-protein ligase Ubr3 [Phthorimaea operculella]|nr:E3 ubiquitin-protein ligase Ubr3 [Phthorimaea operculella]